MNMHSSFELKNHHFIAVLSFLTLLLAFNQLWVIEGDGDSIVYATVSKTIAESGNWLTPTYNFRLFFDHPPLLLWVNALLFKIFGFEEWVPRLFTGISGLGAVLLVFYIGNRYANQYTGFFAGISLLLSYDFIQMLNKNRMEIPLLFLYICGLYGFLRGIEGDKKGFYLSGIFAGLAFLTKGIVSAGIFVISFILIFDLKKVSLLKRKEIWLFILISLLIPATFFIAQYHVNGEEFFKKYFFGQVFQSIKEGPNPSSPFYYLGYILVAYLPWLPFFLHGIVITLRDGEKYPLWRMTLFWCAVIFISFSVASSKRHYYLLPMFPAMSLLTGRSLDRLLTEGKKLIFFRVIVLICVSASLFLAISPIPLHRNSYPEIYKMAPYLKEVLTENDLIISYRNREGISTPSFYLINDKLKIEYCYKPEELQELIKNNKTKRIILCTSDKNVEDNTTIIEGFFPFIENNGLRFYSNDPNVKLSGHIY